MKLSLSVRVAESLSAKRVPAMSLESLAQLAVDNGYRAVCMRASQLGIQTPLDEVREKAAKLAEMGLAVSMMTGDFPIPENTDDAPDALRNITPYLDLAEALGTDLMRIGMKREDDIVWAQRASDEAGERGIRLAHQSHTLSLFETVEGSLDVLRRVDRDNFGIIYEPANLEQCAEDYGPDTVRAFLPYTFNVYMQNLRITPDGESHGEAWSRGKFQFDQVPMWEDGGLDFAPAMTALEEAGYDGYVTLHQAATPPATTEEFVVETAKYLRGVATFS
jgi:sugar phosphate isomerase/epimerase